jgi:hypothetical protein
MVRTHLYEEIQPVYMQIITNDLRTAMKVRNEDSGHSIIVDYRNDFDESMYIRMICQLTRHVLWY